VLCSVFQTALAGRFIFDQYYVLVYLGYIHLLLNEYHVVQN